MADPSSIKRKGSVSEYTMAQIDFQIFHWAIREEFAEVAKTAKRLTCVSSPHHWQIILLNVSRFTHTQKHTQKHTLKRRHILRLFCEHPLWFHGNKQRLRPTCSSSYASSMVVTWCCSCKAGSSQKKHTRFLSVRQKSLTFSWSLQG